MRVAWVAAVVVGCGGAAATGGGTASATATAPASASATASATASASASATASATASASASALLPVAPDVEIRDGDGAVVGGAKVAFDGVSEGLAWPALRKALGAKGQVSINVAREAPVEAVLRAVWTLRDADVRVQTRDGIGIEHVVDLRPKPTAPEAGCHLAVFVGDAGALRIAAPGGARAMPDAATLARALADERTRCPIRYVAFGAESPRATWGAVFDAAWVVVRDGAAGDARVVLATPLHAPTK